MNWIVALYAILKSIPQLIELINAIEKKNEDLNLDRKLKDDIKEISKAFEARDAEALKKVFMS
jgi:hypothetical protein